jgi:hypothetical protein
MSLLTKEVEVTWNNYHKKYYVDKGYTFTNIFEKFIVAIENLSLNSQALVEVKCDSCGTIFWVKYKHYLENCYVAQSEESFCKICYSQMILPSCSKPQSYWSSENNALFELKTYIEKYGTLKNMHKNKDGRRISVSLNTYKYNKENLCNKLGFNYLELRERNYPFGYFEDYTNFKTELYILADKLNRIPKLNEIMDNFQIGQVLLEKHGGMKHVYDLLSEKYNSLLKDDSGFYNRSNYEYIIAQFLIHNNVYYLREQHPFPYPYHNLRSDFTLFNNNGDIFQLELWGFYVETDRSKRYLDYKNKRKLKESLYQKYNINLISLNGDLLNGKYDKVQSNICELLNQYVDNKLHNMDFHIFMSPKDFTDIELYDEIMKLSDDSRFTPFEEVLKNHSSLHVEMNKRYGNLNGFAKRFNILTHSKCGLWDKDLIFKIMLHMYNTYGKLLYTEEIKKINSLKQDDMLMGFICGVRHVYVGIIDAYLDFYELILINNKSLKNDDILYLQRLSNGRFFTTRTATPERREKAQILLDTYCLNHKEGVA